ncbi:Cilia- and flagella-associated protein 91, partial [Rhizophlyctis rosea]
MASQTLVQTHIAPSRPHDYLYDANFTVSSRKDHVKAILKSQTHDVMINPSFQNMFSSLRNYPSTTYTLRAHHLPLYLGQDRRPPQGSGNADVAGVDRYKFFRRPVVPYVPSLGGQVVYARRAAPVVVRAREVKVEEGGVRTVAVQTMYRESSAQTDPYSPPYTLPSTTSPPELLALATLSYGAGLPAGLAELEMIERARAKRAWEASLPKVVDQESFERRLRMMEEMELKEWREREDEIRRLQDHRLEILKKVITRREAENEALNSERIEKIWQRKLQERDALLEKIQRKRVKILRKLADKRAKVEQKIERRDIIADYANFSSNVYAPKARDGVFFDKPDTTLRFDLVELEDHRGLTYLESTLPPSATAPNLTPPDITKDQIRRNPAIRKNILLQQQLNLMDQKLKERKMQRGKEDEKPLRFAKRIERPPQRPGTPSIETPREEDEDMEVAALLLQKIIRGRIAQNAMYQGKERRLNLINELRTRVTIRRAQEAQGLVQPRAPSAQAKRAASAKKKSSRPASAVGVAPRAEAEVGASMEERETVRVGGEEGGDAEVGVRKGGEERGESVSGMVRWGEEDSATEEVGEEQVLEEFEDEEEIILPG